MKTIKTILTAAVYGVVAAFVGQGAADLWLEETTDTR